MKTRFLSGAITIACAAVFLSWMGGDEAVKLASTDKYNVIKVDGRIVYQKTNVDMMRGDVYMTGTSLLFTSIQSRAAIVSAQKGRFVLSGAEKGETKILPAANNISSRAGALINMVDLKNHFSGRYLIIDKMELELNPETFPMNEGAFFYLTFQHDGEAEPIRKMLAHNGDHLILDKAEIFMIDGKAIPVTEKVMTLYYRKDGQSSKISEFTPVFPDTKELKSEVDIILSEYATSDTPTKVKEVMAYLTEFYGTPQKENLEAWMTITYDLK